MLVICRCGSFLPFVCILREKLKTKAADFLLLALFAVVVAVLWRDQERFEVLFVAIGGLALAIAVAGSHIPFLAQFRPKDFIIQPEW